MEYRTRYHVTPTATVIDVLEHYGWHIIISVVIVCYLSNLFKPRFDRYMKWKREQELAAQCHKEPELLSQRLQAQRERVLYLQQQHEKDAELHQQKLRERESKKLEEIAKKYENTDVGNTLGSLEDKNKKSFKPEYNPLMGDNTRTYRPQRKSPCSGGGCGK